MTLLTEGPGRHIPASVKRAVGERDNGQCAFVGAVGRCTERGFLEYHHRILFSDGGATRIDNLELRCRAHNAFEVERWSGVREEDLVREVFLADLNPDRVLNGAINLDAGGAADGWGDAPRLPPE